MRQSAKPRCKLIDGAALVVSSRCVTLRRVSLHRMQAELFKLLKHQCPGGVTLPLLSAEGASLSNANRGHFTLTNSFVTCRRENSAG